MSFNLCFNSSNVFYLYFFIIIWNRKFCKQPTFLTMWSLSKLISKVLFEKRKPVLQCVFYALWSNTKWSWDLNYIHVRPPYDILDVTWTGSEPEIFNLGRQAQIGNFWALEQGFRGPTLKVPHGSAQKAPNGIQGKAPENFGYSALQHMFFSIRNLIFRVDVRVA